MEIARSKRFGFETSRALVSNWFLPTRFSQLFVVPFLATFFAFLLLPPRDLGTSSSCWRFCPVVAFLGVPLASESSPSPTSLRLLIWQRIGNIPTSYRSSDNLHAWNAPDKMSDLEDARVGILEEELQPVSTAFKRNGKVSTSLFFHSCCSTMLRTCR